MIHNPTYWYVAEGNKLRISKRSAPLSSLQRYLQKETACMSNNRRFCPDLFNTDREEHQAAILKPYE